MASNGSKRLKAKSRTGPIAPTARELKLADALEIAVDALGFYADPATYYAISILCDRPCGAFADDMENLRDGISRPGKRAYEAMLAIKNIISE